jgi:dTDP-4-dehydrorhamnose 3,5-epimerase
MPLELDSSHLGGEVLVIVPTVLGDDRGFFMETYRHDNFRDMGLPTEWVQDNHSRSSKGVLRGLHFQWSPPMSKLMRVTRGAAFLVAVDIRKGSPTLGKWFGLEVTANNKKQVYATSARCNTSAPESTIPKPNLGFIAGIRRSTSSGHSQMSFCLPRIPGRSL